MNFLSKNQYYKTVFKAWKMKNLFVWNEFSSTFLSYWITQNINILLSIHRYFHRIFSFPYLGHIYIFSILWFEWWFSFLRDWDFISWFHSFQFVFIAVIIKMPHRIQNFGHNKILYDENITSTEFYDFFFFSLLFSAASAANFQKYYTSYYIKISKFLYQYFIVIDILLSIYKLIKISLFKFL